VFSHSKSDHHCGRVPLTEAGFADFELPLGCLLTHMNVAKPRQSVLPVCTVDINCVSQGVSVPFSPGPNPILILTGGNGGFQNDLAAA
jgi:hypothetical protein